MKISMVPPEKQVIERSVMPSKSDRASDSGASRTSRLCPSASAASPSWITVGRVQLPPTQPRSSPSSVTIARSPGLPDVGRSTRTTVAVANGSPRRSSSCARLKKLSVT